MSAPAPAAVPISDELSEETLRSVIASCAERFDLLASIAADEAAGPEPLDGARYIVSTIDDLAADLALLRASVRRASI